MESNLTILFRCDASLHIGSGHVMRCLTLAKELFNRGMRVAFLTNEGGRHVVERFATHSIHIETIHNSINELDQIKLIIERHQIKYMIWDSYKILLERERIVTTWLPVMIIDDTYLLPSYSCDAILNQNIYAVKESYQVTSHHTTILAGSQYTLLREAFRLYKDEYKPLSTYVRKILVTFGGSDSENVTLKVLEVLDQLQEYSFEISIVLGAHYAFDDSIQNFINKNTRHKYSVYKNITTMAELLWKQDFVISASGSTMYELAILGVPSCCLAIAKNQVQVAKSFFENGASMYGGDSNVLQAEEFANLLQSIINDVALRQSMSAAGRKLIDGNGVSRVADYISERINAEACK